MKKLIFSPVLWLILTGICIAITLLTNLNFIPLLLSFAFFLIAVITTARRSPSPETLALKLSPAIEEELKSVDFSTKDILVGTVRTAEQLDYCLETKQYYVPAKFLDDAPFPLDSIALHEEDIGTEPGIRWYGRISAVALVKRSTIPVPMRPGADPEEIYYQYSIESWQERKPAIRILDSYRGRPNYTCKFLFEHCGKSYQLFSVTSEADYRLMCILDHLYEGLYAGKAPELSYQLNENLVLTLQDDHIFITNSQGWIREKTPVHRFLASPKVLFRQAKKITRSHRATKTQ